MRTASKTCPKSPSSFSATGSSPPAAPPAAPSPATALNAAIRLEGGATRRLLVVRWLRAFLAFLAFVGATGSGLSAGVFVITALPGEPAVPEGVGTTQGESPGEGEAEAAVAVAVAVALIGVEGALFADISTFVCFFKKDKKKDWTR